MFRLSSQSHIQAVISSFSKVKVSSVFYRPFVYLYGSSINYYIWVFSSLNDDEFFPAYVYEGRYRKAWPYIESTYN
jgi:hypothetical protein